MILHFQENFQLLFRVHLEPYRAVKHIADRKNRTAGPFHPSHYPTGFFRNARENISLH